MMDDGPTQQTDMLVLNGAFEPDQIEVDVAVRRDVNDLGLQPVVAELHDGDLARRGRRARCRAGTEQEPEGGA